MEILCVLVSIEGPFCATLKHPGKKDMVSQGLFLESKLSKGRLFLQGKDTEGRSRENITNVCVNLLTFRFQNGTFVLDPSLYIQLERSEFVCEKFTVSIKRRSREDRPSIGDPRGKIRII